MKLKPFVKTNKKGKVAAGSLTFSYKKPQPGYWKEVNGTSSVIIADFTPWTLVTGGEAGDGTALVNSNSGGVYTIIGPNDSNDNGWVYLKQYFPLGANLEINYDFSTFDEGLEFDRPVYWASNTEPTGIPDNTTARVSTSPESGTWNVTVNPGEWFAVGIYSTDSCCGRGFLQVDFNI